jgi:hypothetical protein
MQCHPHVDALAYKLAQTRASVSMECAPLLALPQDSNRPSYMPDLQLECAGAADVKMHLQTLHGHVLLDIHQPT